MLSHLFAYLDLASGSMIIQAAIAGMVAVPILLRNQIRRLLGRGATTDDGLPEPGVAAAAGVDVHPEPRLEGPGSTRP
jgi:hypothetical protein